MAAIVAAKKQVCETSEGLPFEKLLKMACRNNIRGVRGLRKKGLSPFVFSVRVTHDAHVKETITAIQWQRGKYNSKFDLELATNESGQSTQIGLAETHTCASH